MDTANSQQPASNVDQVPVGRNRICGLVLEIVVVNVAFNVNNALQHWSELTLLHHVVGIALWLVLPLVAVWLLYWGKRSGRWMLVGLFGLRAAADLLALGMVWMPLVIRDPWSILAWPCRGLVIEATFYVIASLWLVISRSIREIAS